MMGTVVVQVQRTPALGALSSLFDAWITGTIRPDFEGPRRACSQPSAGASRCPQDSREVAPWRPFGSTRDGQRAGRSPGGALLAASRRSTGSEPAAASCKAGPRGWADAVGDRVRRVNFAGRQTLAERDGSEDDTTRTIESCADGATRGIAGSTAAAGRTMRATAPCRELDRMAGPSSVAPTPP